MKPTADQRHSGQRAGEAVRLEALACWYAPWRHADPSWLEQPEEGDWPRALGTTEPECRVNYRAWCARLALPLHPESCDGSLWWRVAGTPLQDFARINYLVGLVLLLVRTPRASLVLAREAARVLAGTAAVRWALQRASLVPARQFTSDYWAGADDPAAAGALAVQLAVGCSVPALLSRMRLRYARTAALQRRWGTNRGTEQPPGRAEGAELDTLCARWVEKLWTGAENLAEKKDAAILQAA